MQIPVVTSNISPMKEVSGGAAFLADPFEVASIKEGILKIINDDDYRSRIIKEGTQNIKRFEPQLIAGLYEKLYLEILSELK